MLYLFCFIDRANIGKIPHNSRRLASPLTLLLTGNAKLAGFEKDLKLKGYDYNKILSVFYISYILFEIPSNMLCKLVGPGWYLPAISLGFGLCSVFTAFCHDIHSVSGVRFLLGMFEVRHPTLTLLFASHKQSLTLPYLRPGCFRVSHTTCPAGTAVASSPSASRSTSSWPLWQAPLAVSWPQPS